VLQRIVQICGEAGSILMGFRARGQQAVNKKTDGSPVSEADLEADRLIRTRLNELDVSIPVLSEESGAVDYAIRKDWPRYWLVDPLDGTKEFLSGRDDFTVNIALIEQGKPVLGVVSAPGRGVTYFAGQACGAWKQTGNESLQRLFSELRTMDDEHIVVESNSHPSAEMEEFLKTLKIKDRIRLGSSLKFCCLAEGSATLYPRFVPCMEWDVAAGDAVFRYSARTGEHPSPFTYNKVSLENPKFILGLKENERSDSWPG
jgi:3'(2'), 5'-bisphosphate nucleotidase